MRVGLSWMGIGGVGRGRRLAVAAVALLALPSGYGQKHPAAKAPDLPAAPADAKMARLTAGPTYTGAEGKTDPQFPNVDVVFTLTGADGNPIQAQPGDLKLFSEGSEVGTASSIRPFEKTGYGLTAILALDASGSMRGAPIAAIHATIAKFVNQARKQDRVAVVTFADETKVDVPFGAGQDALTQELQTVEPRGKFTRLYDGLLDALALFQSDQPKRRQLVVISDGHDEGSTHTLADVLVKANQLTVTIDAIGLTKDRGAYLGTLEQLAVQTGGTYERAMNAADLDRMIDRGIAANRATPVAAFQTEHLAGDGAPHSTELRWKPGNLQATAFIATPKISLLRNPWLWGLGGCFVAGVVLLAISWFGSKSGGKMAVPSGGAFAAGLPSAPAVPPLAPPLAPSVASARKTPTTFEGASGVAPGMPIALETLPAPGAFGPLRAGSAPLPPTVPAAAAYTTSGGPASGSATGGMASPKDILSKERGKTKLAAFFDAPDQGPYALIRVKTGDLAGTAIPMTTTTFSLGATAGNSLILPGDATISGQHLRLIWEGSILKLEDLQSTNGTFVNGLKVGPGRHLLRPGDEVRMGQTVMVLERC